MREGRIGPINLCDCVGWVERLFEIVVSIVSSLLQDDKGLSHLSQLSAAHDLNRVRIGWFKFGSHVFDGRPGDLLHTLVFENSRHSSMMKRFTPLQDRRANQEVEHGVICC